MKRNVLLLLFGCFAWGSCQGPTQVTALLGLSKSVLDLVNSFITLHKEFTSKTNDVIVTTHKGLQTKEHSLSEVAKFWEYHWDNIEDKYNSLSTHLTEIEANSLEYFKQLDANNESISDTSLRRMDFERNEVKKRQWQNQYAETTKNMQKAEEMIRKGKDWLKVLANAAAREELDLFIKDMEMMSYTAKFTLPSDIKNFETNAKLIFKSE